MNELIITIIGGLTVVLVASWLGIGGGTHRVVVHGSNSKKTGKWIIIIAVLMVLVGLSLNAGTEEGVSLQKPTAGSVIAMYGVLFFIVGKVVAWFQKP